MITDDIWAYFTEEPIPGEQYKMQILLKN